VFVERRPFDRATPHGTHQVLDLGDGGEFARIGAGFP
jgi:hypothetical protein